MLIDESNSRESQDLFVLAMTGKKQNGTFVEVGGCYPDKANNTYLLEKKFGWKGFSVEWDKFHVKGWKEKRSSPLLCEDATKLDYGVLIDQYFGTNHIDYLQLDVDPPNITLQVLQRINFSKYSFSVITYEHDLYNGGVYERTESRKIFQNNGYVRVISDVVGNKPIALFEDWYIHPDYVPENVWKDYVGDTVRLDNSARDPRYTELFRLLG